jgi:hypothetical protein
MSPRRRGRGRGYGGSGGGAVGASATGSRGRGPASGADLAAAPSPSAAEIGPLAQETVTVVNGSTLAAASTNTTAHPTSGFASNGGSGPGPGRGGNASRGADSRRPPRADAPSVIEPSVIAASPQQDAGVLDQPAGQRTSSCTLAQMRRFIKSRPYVPVHELRRRFLIEGIEDEVSPVSTGQLTLYVGLPAREAQFLGDLIRSGEVGCEMLLDPAGPGVVGVYPMRPVARQ